MADLLVLAEAATEAAEPSALGLTPPMWVALSMLVLIVIMLVLKVPALLTRGLDSSIAEIRKQLDEAKALRADAEALKAEYAARIANAEKDVAAMMAHAKTEADAIIAKAESDTTAVIARREKMAADKIEAAERGAVAELRGKAAEAAAAAAKGLITSHYGADADRAQVDSAIAAI
jgi:F-type H+-transporting ATPase subunit b